MNLELSWLRLVPLVALSWGLPTEVGAELSHQEFFDGRVEKLETIKNQQLFMSVQQPSVRQPIVLQKAEVKQNDTETDVLVSVEGALTSDDAQLNDGSLHDVHVFEGEVGQIVRIRLVSEEFDAFLLLQNASGEELTQNGNGSTDGTNAEIVFRLPETGQYRILANAYGESGKGAYRLTVERSDEHALQQVELKAEADRLNQQGIDSFQLRQYQSALDSWQAALKIYREIGNRQGEATSLGNLGSTYYSQRDYLQAVDFSRQALVIAREIGFRQGEANSLGNLGNVYHSQGNYQQAIDFHQQSLVIAREIGFRQGEANSLGNLGNVYFRLRDYPQATDFSQQSLIIAREIGDRQSEANSLGNLGNVYNSLGDYPKAIDFSQQSLIIAREIGDRQGEANSLGNLGNVYNSLEDYPKAIDSHQQSLAIDREIGDRQGEANSLGNLGIVYYRLGDYPKAIDFLQQFLAIARELRDRQGEAISLGNLGTAHDSRGEHPQAIDFHQQSLAIAHEIGDRQGEAGSLANLGVSYLKKKELTSAVISLFDAISIYESLRSSELPDQDRINFFETQAQAYTNLVLALASQNKYTEALEVAERGRTRSFVQLVSERLSEKTETQVLANSQSSQSFGDMKKVAAAQQSVLVEYSVVTTPDNIQLLYVWVMQPAGQLDFRQVSLGDDLNRLTELVNQSRRSIGARGRGFILADPDTNEAETADKLRELHQLMIEPIADLLPSDPAQRVVFVPQGDLFLVPFPALMDESGEYLIEQHTILTAPSIQVLDLTQRQATARADNASTNLTALLAVGNPVMPEVWDTKKAINTRLPPLMGAEQEAQDIADFFNTEALLGAEATEQAVKQQIGSARIVHLATHGLLEYGTPEESGVRDVPGAIALAPNQNEDGLLTSAEILELDLQADLVVLSACDTGLGTITGDGVIGLSRSLIAAGAPSVIVSLWSIPDAPTAELMTEFYRQRQQGKDKAQALRQAMLVTMESHPNPGEWAAFTLIGEAD
jgi:CHAT domain-containing protein/tetratricopeptide (TPR) repeat protein